MCDFYGNIGSTLIKLHKYDELIKKYDKAVQICEEIRLEISVEFVVSMSGVGETLSELSKYSGAMKKCENTIQIYNELGVRNRAGVKFLSVE